MKKTLLSIFATVMLLIGVLPLASCSDKDDDGIENVITFNKLPAEAQNFINTYFNGYTILKIDKETNGNISVYEVYLEEGYVVVFNNAGNWEEVYAPEGKTIPDGIVPPVIQDYLNQNYSDYGVNEINRTGSGYKVDLVTGLSLYFNESGEVMQIGNAF